MIILRHKLARLVILGIIVLALLVFAAFQAGGGNPGLAAGTSPNSTGAISPGQQAAIDGALQLLLLQPQNTHSVYLPLAIR
ncbi:MAG: hypothetical protein P8Y03_25110 [Anaerolineales bacterium]|jgi:hypothetical protein